MASILEQARGNVVRAVNTNMVLAYWLIGREIVQEIQGGGGRAAYGRQVLDDLSRKLTKRYGAGFSETSLKYFRTFYLVYADRSIQIRHPLGDESTSIPHETPIGRPSGDLLSSHRRRQPDHRADSLHGKERNGGEILRAEGPQTNFRFQIHALSADRVAAPRGSRAGTPTHRSSCGNGGHEIKSQKGGSPMNSREARERLAESLQLDLIGPENDHVCANELLPDSPY
ncbi:MAG: DUF1016 N-terminal domain-containing protein [Verrucomicrobia bacterium]|nr:DUF1016 N-terminal domain-containing protein [Verrucomicrobiota bacterium]